MASPPLAVVWPSAADWLQLLTSKFSIAHPASLQPSASFAKPTATGPPKPIENVATLPDNYAAAPGSLASSYASGAASSAPVAAPAVADSDDNLLILKELVF